MADIVGQPISTGLVGIISRSPSGRVSEAELADLAATYETLRGAGRRHSATAGTRAAIYAFGSDYAPSEIETDGASWAAAVGIVRPPGTLIGRGLDELEGHFVLVKYDAERDEVVVASDPFGFQSLFLAERGDRTYVSTSALALAKHLGAEADRHALLSFLRTGYHWGALTHWREIERLDPATCLRFDARGSERTTYYMPTVDRAVTRLGLEAAVDHCIEVIVETFRRHLGTDGRTWSDLTGGFDSRLLALLLREAGVPFDAGTRGSDQYIDVQIARKVARIAGWDWQQFTFPENWGEILPSLVHISLAWGDGNLDMIELAWVLWAHAQASQRHRSLMIGSGTEHFRNHAWSQEFTRAGRSNQVNFDNWVNMRAIHPLDVSVLVEDPTPQVAANYVQRMRARTAPYAGELNTTQLDVMFAYTMTGWLGTYRSADAAYLSSEMPCYCRPIFAAGFSTDYRLRNNHRLNRHMIERLDTRVAAVRTSSGGPAQGWRLANLHRFLPFYAQRGRRAITKITQTQIGRPWLAPKPGEVPRILAMNLGPLLADMGQNGSLRHADMRSGALYREDELNSLFQRASDRQLGESTLLNRILTVELALRATGASLDES